MNGFSCTIIIRVGSDYYDYAEFVTNDYNDFNVITLLKCCYSETCLIRSPFGQVKMA